MSILYKKQELLPRVAHLCHVPIVVGVSGLSIRFSLTFINTNNYMYYKRTISKDIISYDGNKLWYDRNAYLLHVIEFYAKYAWLIPFCPICRFIDNKVGQLCLHWCTSVAMNLIFLYLFANMIIYVTPTLYTRCIKLKYSNAWVQPQTSRH